MTAKVLQHKNALRQRRKVRARGKIFGTEQKPRVSIFRSNRYVYAQAIDDTRGVTLAAVDGSKLGTHANKEAVAKTAKAFAEKLKANKIETIVFDRNGYLYHGVVAAFADTLRECGIRF